MNLKDVKSTINMNYSEVYEIDELKERRLYINTGTIRIKIVYL